MKNEVTHQKRGLICGFCLLGLYLCWQGQDTGTGANLGVCWSATRATPLPSAKAGEGRGGSHLKKHFGNTLKALLCF